MNPFMTVQIFFLVVVETKFAVETDALATCTPGLSDQTMEIKLITETVDHKTKKTS